MVSSGSSFPEIQGKKQLKLCGNCDSASFGLNREEVEFLNRTPRWGYPLKTMRHWLTKKNMKMPGGFPNLDKKRVVEIVLKHRFWLILAWSFWVGQKGSEQVIRAHQKEPETVRTWLY
jgi:hypothetical protein